MIITAKHKVNNKYLPLIVYDGYCIFCSNLIKISLLLGADKHFYFTTIDSPLTTQLIKNFDTSSINIGDSALVITPNKLYSSSDAVLFILKKLNPLFYLIAQLLDLLPSKLLDKIYYFFANRRYKLMGKANKCIIPTKKQKHKFIL